MPEDKIRVTIEGDDEVNRALDAVADFDKVAAANRAAEAVIPYVRANTRVLTGLMSASWQAKDESFVNTVPYSIYQEYGTVYVDPTHAIQRAWNSHSDEAVKAYGAEIDSAIQKAGLEP